MLLIFDLDGTLFQAKPVVLLAVRRLFEELGLPVPDEGAVLKNAGRGAAAMLAAVLPEGVEASAAMPLFYKQLRSAILERGELYAGAKETVRKLYDEGHKLAICSNSPMIYIELVMKHTGIGEFFALCLSAEGHPSKAVQIGKLLKPGETAIVIGDTHGDLSAAHENGLKAIAAAYGYGNKDLLKSADYTAHTPEEILDCVRRL